MKSETKTGLFLGILIVLIGGLYIYGTFFNWSSETSGNISMSNDDAYQLLDTADEVVIRGDLEKWVQKPSIWVGERYLGNLMEKGILNWQIKLLIGKAEFFNISYADTDSDAPDLSKGYNLTSTRYVYRYPDKRVAGYAEQTTLKRADGSGENVYLFYGDDLKRRLYLYSGTGGWCIYGLNGEVLVKAVYEYNSLMSTYEIHMKSFTKNVVDLKDKIFLCSMLISSIQSNHHQG